MAKITMKVSVSMRETFDDFLLFKKSMGLSEKTLRTYKEHLTSIGKHLPIDNSMDSIKQKDLERMISSMDSSCSLHNNVIYYDFCPQKNERRYSNKRLFLSVIILPLCLAALMLATNFTELLAQKIFAHHSLNKTFFCNNFLNPSAVNPSEEF